MLSVFLACKLKPPLISLCNMFRYIVKRILLIIPTLFGITVFCFLINTCSPGGPIEQKLAELRFSGGLGGEMGGGGTGSSSEGSNYSVPEEVLEELKRQYGFDKPVPVQYLLWLKNISTLSFGKSFVSEEPVIDMIAERLPVSLQFGVVSLILTYLVCIVLGVMSAVRKGAPFDVITSVLLIVFYAIPPLMLGILLKVFLAGGSYLDWFPLGDLYSDSYFEKGFWGRVGDRIHHFVLPCLCYMIGSFTVLTQFMRNNLLDEINLDYVRTARAKGLSEKVVIYKHALRNALVPLVTGLGSIFGIFLAGSLIIEKLFSINGIGLLAFTSVLQRDYNVIMALIFIQSSVFLFGRLFSDIIYVLIDPRIDFS